jgi:thiol:disulfide interchange protein DsbD
LIAIVGLSNIVSSFGRVTSQQIITNGTWLPWSSSQVSEDRKMGRAVFVDYTAAWCITCQVNKKLVLNDPAVIASFEKNNVITYRADWTSRDAEITNSLSTFGRSGVPVYVYYPPNQKPPLVLSEILNDEDIFELFEY